MSLSPFLLDVRYYCVPLVEMAQGSHPFNLIFQSCPCPADFAIIILMIDIYLLMIYIYISTVDAEVYKQT